MRQILIYTTILIALFTSASKSPAVAEILPRNGTFEGTYHRDPWNVGHFDFFLVHPDLHSQLAKYEGIRSRLVVENANQPMNPGSAIITDIGKIAVLDPLPLQLTIETHPTTIQAGEPFQLVLRVWNRGDKPLTVRNTDVMIRNRTPRAVRDPDAPSYFMPEYTTGQLSVSDQHYQMYDELAKQSVWGFARLSGAHSFEVKPGEKFPLVVLYREGLRSGIHEFEASCGVPLPDVDSLPDVMAWHQVRVSEEKKTRHPEEELLQITESSIHSTDDGYEASVVVAHKRREPWRVVKSGDRKDRAFSGFLEAFDQNGTSLPLKLNEPHARIGEPEPWQLMDVDEAGIHLMIQFRQHTLFAPAAIKRLVLRVLTQHGLETFALADDFSDVHVPESTAFGDPIEGVQLRIRPDRPNLVTGDLTFHLQALNVGGSPILFRMPRDKMGGNVIIEIDGEAIAPTNSPSDIAAGWAGENTCATPYEWTITLPKEVELSAGVHTIRYTVNSPGGTYQNAHHDSVPILRGRLSSAQVSFKVN